MKIKVKQTFFAPDGLHKKGEILEIDPAAFSEDRMELIEEPKVKKPEAKAESKKAPAKKKG